MMVTRSVGSKKSWDGQRVLVIGAARQGLALARFLYRRGARVTLNDRRSADEMKEESKNLENDLAAVTPSTPGSVDWVLGEHSLGLLDNCDIVFVSGGVSTTLPIVKEAQRRTIPISNDTQIFMENVPCRVVGITGSAGKTTTTTLVGRMACMAVEGASPDFGEQPTKVQPEGCTPVNEDPVPLRQKVWVGGNIGLPLIDHMESIKPGDVVILELSSFQLELMTCSPDVSAILNITPNHLDRHGTMEAYTAAKARILTYQELTSAAVLGRDDPGAWRLADQVRGRLVTFGLQPLSDKIPGTYSHEDKLYLYDGETEQEIMPESLIRLRGIHNLLNVLAACAILYATSLVDTEHAACYDAKAMQAGVKDFTGVAHRLELVRTWNGADWYNDSIATAPERTIAAIRSFNEPIVLLLGGRDKNLPWEELADLVRRRVDHVIIFGEAAPLIQKAIGSLETASRTQSLTRCTGLQEAVMAATRLVQPGDVVLLSPAATSFDEFRDFEERGERFREWIHQLP